jgi:hypothetical protein
LRPAPVHLSAVGVRQNTMLRYQLGGFGASGWRQSGPPPLSLDQNGLIGLKVFLHTLLVGKRQGCPLGIILDELVMHQVFAYKLDEET